MSDQNNDKPGPAHEPSSNQERSKSDVLLFILAAGFIALAIIGMMLIDQYGQEKMGDASHVQDAADR